jgi:hypothetical protein
MGNYAHWLSREKLAVSKEKGQLSAGPETNPMFTEFSLVMCCLSALSLPPS